MSEEMMRRADRVVATVPGYFLDRQARSEVVEAVARALQEVRNEAMEEAARVVCHWCREDYPIAPGEPFGGNSLGRWHKRDEDANYHACDAFHVRALRSKEPTR